VILEGKVAMSKLNENDDQIVIAERVPGEIFGEMALLDGLPRSATVRAIEPSLFLVINRADFIHAIMETPEIALKIMATLCNRLREADRLRVLRLSVRQNVILLLLQMARSRGITDSKGRVRFANNLSGSEMGRRILATRESVSREMSKLRREGKIRTSGRDILIPDLNSLEAEIPL
jgi:CRP-like cAMP-binding protein